MIPGEEADDLGVDEVDDKEAGIDSSLPLLFDEDDVDGFLLVIAANSFCTPKADILVNFLDFVDDLRIEG